MQAKDVITSQYLASLEMLTEAITACPETLWDDPGYHNRFWHIAYHVLFYTDLYLQPSERDFQAWEHHRDELHNLRELPAAPQEEPYRKEQLLAYAGKVVGQVGERVEALHLEAASGFHWLPFSKLELQFYNMRHIHHHAGQLMDRLRSRAGIGVGWVNLRRP